ncbi:MAG: TolC family protein [Bacteroidales bacterium]|nr:TolC family protein [Bacteroidales bacterium]
MRKLFIALFIVATTNIAAQDNEALSLEDAVNTALENNYGIIISRKTIDISEMNNTWGNAGALPNIQFVGSGNVSENFSEDGGYTSQQLNSSVELNWTIFRGFSARIRKNRLEEMENLSEGNLAVVVENTIYSVILSYYNILLADQRADIAGSNMELSRDRYQRAQYSKEIGATVTYDLLQAKNAYLRDSSDFLSARSSYRNAVRELNYHMAEPLDRQYNYVSDFSPDTSDFQYSNLVDRMLENNSTLENQYINLELARLDVQSAKSSYYPTLSLKGAGGYAESEQDYGSDALNRLDQSRSGLNASVGISLSYTLFDGNNRKRALEAARIEREISQVETEEMQQDLKNQLAQEYEFYQVRKELLQVADENLEAAELNLELSREKFENGTINSFNFRDVQQIYLDAAYNYQQAIFNVIQSYHTLLRLTGGMIEEYEDQ